MEHLKSINRAVLDFDFEKVCSISLSNINVYACLVCGKYYQGRGKMSHAFIHSLNEHHYVFLNLHTLKFWILPDSFEIMDDSLDDIKFAVNPNYETKDLVTISYINQKKYYPGFVGLNNLKATDYINVVIQALMRVDPLRDYLLFERPNSELWSRFSLLFRKMCNPRAFKPHVSPHELVQEIISGKRFKILKQEDPAILLEWLLESVPKKVFTGSLIAETKETKKRVLKEFNILHLDLPPMPLFQAESEKNLIPQCNLMDLLQKYNGTKLTVLKI